MNLLVKVVIFSTAIYAVYALCNTCTINGLACVANDQFSVCVNGLPSTSVAQCPVGTVCTASAQVCSPTGTAAPSCSRCGSCDVNSAFACTGYNTFALCYGATTPSAVNFTCSGAFVCNVNDPRICVDPTETGIGATCPSSSAVTTTTTTPSPTSTTPSPGVDPQAYCKSVASSGRYDVPTDPNCKQYVLCTLYNSTWIGNLYECSGSTLFNSTAGLCGVEVPVRCAQIGT